MFNLLKIFAYGKIKLNKQKNRNPNGVLIKKGKRSNTSPSAKWPQLKTNFYKINNHFKRQRYGLF